MRATPVISEPNTVPIPTLAPAKPNGSNTGTLDFGSSNHGCGSRLSNDATRLDDVASNVVEEGGGHGTEDDTVLGSLHCTLDAKRALMKMH